MKAWLVKEFNNRNNLKLETVQLKIPQSEEVKVNIRACGINNKDIYLRKGIYYRGIDLPLILGSDMAGVVDEIGSEVNSFLPGDRVVVSPVKGCGICEACENGEENCCDDYKSVMGGFAESVVLKEKNLIKIPDQFTFEEAAAIPISYLTAWNMLYNKARIKKNETVLFWGATSGVGSAGILMLDNHSKIIAIAGSEEKLIKLRELGITKLINYKKDNVFNKVMNYTNGEGVDIIFDPVGHAAWDNNLEMLKNKGRHVNCARNTGGHVSIDLALLFSKQISILGAKSGSRSDLTNILNHLHKKSICPLIDRVFEFDEAEEALQYQESGHHIGKVVLKI